MQLDDFYTSRSSLQLHMRQTVRGCNFAVVDSLTQVSPVLIAVCTNVAAIIIKNSWHWLPCRSWCSQTFVNQLIFVLNSSVVASMCSDFVQLQWVYFLLSCRFQHFLILWKQCIMSVLSANFSWLLAERIFVWGTSDVTKTVAAYATVTCGDVNAWHLWRCKSFTYCHATSCA